MAATLPALIKHLRRVAIVGLPNSGKTVLLTSLLIHLENRSAALTDGGKWQIRSFRPQRERTIGKQLPEFPYKSYRTHLRDNWVFPSKTTSETVFSFDLDLSSGRGQKEYQVDLLDVPGERFYDIAMCGCDYGQWCDELERSWQDEPHPAMETYRKLFDAPPAEVEAPAIIAAYRTLLAELIADYRTSIAPSSFRVSASANTVRGRTPSAILASAEANPCGVSPGCQFAPIFGEHRTKFETIATTMSKNYDAYRENVVLPLFRELKVCDRLVLLIDVPNLLASGAGAISDQTHLIEQVLRALVPARQGVWRSLGRGLRDLGLNIASTVNLSLRPGQVERVAFVATKADVVAVSDVQENRLSTLLHQLVQPTCNYLNGIEPEEFVISAVKSTTNADKPDDETSGHLYGRLQFDFGTDPPTRRKPTDPKVDYDVPRLPKEWPHSLSGGYSYPPVFPDIPQLRMVCPKEEQLKKLFDFIIS
ncbi:MAG TPA: YcjX family protein [Pirellulales bacterium]|nr:YcjX family protein [Pirellulales bacterium]